MTQRDPDGARTQELISRLTKAYWAELETVMNYIACSINPDGVRARDIAQILATDVQEELAHAQLLGSRIKELYGVVPGSMEFTPGQKELQPPADQTDIVHVIKGVIAAERDAIAMYHELAEFCDGFDLVTQDIAVTILRDEQGHLRLFEGFLREYEAGDRT